MLDLSSPSELVRKCKADLGLEGNEMTVGTWRVLLHALDAKGYAKSTPDHLKSRLQEGPQRFCVERARLGCLIDREI